LLLVPSQRASISVLIRSRRRVAILTAGAGFLAANWFTYVWAVNHGEVVQASLGYYANPLVSVLLGVVVLSERLRRLQWVAIGIATMAVVWLTFEYGHVPWVALVLAVSFALYGLFKKQADAPAVQSMVVEAGALAPAALAYIVAVQAAGIGTFTSHGTWHAALLISAGPVTIVPLLLFAGAATRVPLSVIGLLQYLTPTMQLVLGVVVQHEPLPPARFAGFCGVWVALVVLGLDSVRAGRVRRREALAPSVTSGAA
jgi:chloramphenicol-sensitive protein RarD